MPRTDASNLLPRVGTFATLVGVVAVLYFARDLFIPVALAAFIAMLLQPLVSILERRRIGRVPAVVIVMIVALTPVVGIGWAVVSQSAAVLHTLPDYRDNIAARLESVRALFGREIKQGAVILKDIQKPAPAEQPTSGPEPVPVAVVEPAPDTVTVFKDLATPLVHPFAALGVALVLVVFFLCYSEDVRDRLIRLISSERLTHTTSAIDDINVRIGSFLRAQFLVNAGTGIVIALALWLIGVPNALLWGFLAGALRFIPYLGSFIAAALPITLAIAISTSWTMPLEVLLFFVVFEFVLGNFIEPVVFGARTGISSLALLLMAIFWGWLWGIWGLLLSTQLTVCLVVAGRFVPRLRFLEITLGDQPALEPPEKFYQRLLAMDAEEAAEIAEEFLKSHTLVQAGDAIFIPALIRADLDRRADALDERRRIFLDQALREIVVDAAARAAQLAREKSLAAAGESPSAPPPPAAPDLAKPAPLRVLCIPARDEADALAALMLETLAPDAGFVARALTLDHLGSDLAAIIAEFNPHIVLISSAPPHAQLDSRGRIRQLALKAPGLRLFVGLWGGVPGDAARSRERLLALGVEQVVLSMADAIRVLQGVTPGSPPPAPALANADSKTGPSTKA